jgi:hypothetical protein
VEIKARLKNFASTVLVSTGLDVLIRSVAGTKGVFTATMLLGASGSSFAAEIETQICATISTAIAERKTDFTRVSRGEADASRWRSTCRYDSGD